MKTVHSNQPSPFKHEETFTPGELFILRWQYRTASDFERLLAEAMAKADTKNLNAFAVGFPDEAEAMWKYKTEAGWWDEVSKRYCNWIGWCIDYDSR